jgi:hypothetical protein
MKIHKKPPEAGFYLFTASAKFSAADEHLPGDRLRIVEVEQGPRGIGLFCEGVNVRHAKFESCRWIGPIEEVI